jgi:hypothetical protein
MQRSTSGLFTTGAGAVALVIGLAAIDERVHEEVSALVTGRAGSGELLSFGARLQELAFVALQAVRDQSIEHAPLTLFALAALVLFLLMLRT